MRGLIDRERVNAGPTVDATARTNAVVAPIESIHVVGHRDPDFVCRRAESHTADFPFEHALHSGRRDALARSDHARVGHVALRVCLLRSTGVDTTARPMATTTRLCMMLRSPLF
jgi:hypothetical protein